LSCALCETRREKRFCPALHGRICAQCCGEQREVTLDCPSGCPYLQQAREHEKPRSMGQFDPASLFLEVEIPDQFLYQHQPLLMGLSFALARGARSDRTMHDSDLIAALSALCANHERLVSSGLYYQPALTNIAQQAIASQVEATWKQYRELEQKHAGYSSLRDSDVLRALVFLVRMAYGRTSGRPKSRAFIDFLAGQFPERESARVAPQEAARRIIMP
jgi:hypothetical protein